MSPEWVTDVRFFDITRTVNSPIAVGSFTVANAIVVRMTIWEKKNGGYRVSLPARKNPNFDTDQPPSRENKPYFDEVFPVSKERRTELMDYLLKCALEAGKIKPDIETPSPEFEPNITFP